jgi:hypothetical protein
MNMKSELDIDRVARYLRETEAGAYRTEARIRSNGTIQIIGQIHKSESPRHVMTFKDAEDFTNFLNHRVCAENGKDI